MDRAGLGTQSRGASRFPGVGEPAQKLEIGRQQHALRARPDFARGVRRGMEVIVDRGIDRLLSRERDSHVNDATVRVVASAARELKRLELIECIGDGRARNRGVFGEDRGGDRLGFGGKQDDQHGELQVGQFMGRQRAAQAAVEQCRGFEVEQRQPAAGAVNPFASFRNGDERAAGERRGGQVAVAVRADRLVVIGRSVEHGSLYRETGPV